jgi:hypothetical protein
MSTDLSTFAGRSLTYSAARLPLTLRLDDVAIMAVLDDI